MMQRFFVCQFLLVASFRRNHVLLQVQKSNWPILARGWKNIVRISKNYSLPQPNEQTFLKAEQ